MGAETAPGGGGLLDGGWWPRSTDPATEFLPLITAMAARGLPVVRVSFHLGTWAPGGRRLTVRDTVVELEGFRTAEPHTVVLIGPHRRRTRLLVVPPSTPDDAARAALRAAAETDATAEDILKRHNVPVPGKRAGTTAQPGWRIAAARPRREVADDATRELRAALRGPRRDVRPAGDTGAS
ncbi:DUF5994 family protein [Saccharothrix sp.]|uniref:DUF5994 family protein n=1 Tax=Saccharothrix sp. TaxID=1873460 RepID=UPI00281271F2|nr:DUF5994 family protein [Saccharothrix sp.]